MKKFRVGIVGLLQESNTFISGATRLHHFEDDLYLHGEAIRNRMASAPHEVGGFFQGLEEAGIEAVPLFLARALPYGVIEADTFDHLVNEILQNIRDAEDLDGILAAPHGATVAANFPDADGYWLSRVRDLIGPTIPLIATLDPHANLSPAMVDATDALIAYSTNPHLDQRQTGVAAAKLMGRTLSGEVTPVQAAAFPALAINIQCQNTSEEPLLSFYRDAAELAEPHQSLSHSIILGFPYADVPEMGAAVIVVTDSGEDLAKTKVELIEGEMWDRRNSFVPEFLSVRDAVLQVNQIADAPVVLLDMGDNVGGGSPGDSTPIALEWLKAGEGKAFVCLHDPDLVAGAKAAGDGAVIEGKAGDSSNPINGTFTVHSLSDGKFTESEARHGGFSDFDQGDTALLETDDGKLTIMITSRRMAPFSLAQLTSLGVDPTDYKMIVAKGVIAPMAAYESIAKGGFLHVDSPGVTRADMTKLEYQHRRRPMFPFEDT